MSHFGLVGNPNENPVSAGKVREACCNALRALGERLKNKIDQTLIREEYLKDNRFAYVQNDGKIKLAFNLGDLANQDRTEAERAACEGYYSIPGVVRDYIEHYYEALGWSVTFGSSISDLMYLTVGPVTKELV